MASFFLLIVVTHTLVFLSSTQKHNLLHPMLLVCMFSGIGKPVTGLFPEEDCFFTPKSPYLSVDLCVASRPPGISPVHFGTSPVIILVERTPKLSC